MRNLRLLALLAAAASARASAGGYYAPDIGARAMGRGGAFTARADDLTAAWYNPAGLADQRGTRFHGDLGLIRQSVHYQRTDALGGTAGFFPVGNNFGSRPIPFLALSSDFGLRNLAFSLAVYGAYGRRGEFPEDGPQRYTLVDANVTEAQYQLSVGWRPLRWLSLGAAFRWVDLSVTNRAVISVFGSPDDEASSDVRVAYRVADRFTPNAQLGLMVSPTPWLDIGISYRPPTPIHASGTLEIDPRDVASLRQRYPELLGNLGIQGDEIAVSFGMPMILRSGVRFKQPRWDVEADFVWERWTGFGKLEIVPTRITYTLNSPNPTPLPSIFQDRNYGDAFSFRLGGDVEIVPDLLVLRAGYFFETAAVPTQSLNLNLVDIDKHGFTIGFTLRHRWFAFSASYAHIQLAERQVSDSNSRQINLLYIGLNAQDRAPVVGNGRYRAGWDNLVFGIGIDIDTIVGWTRPK